jgi:hypothetical protein
MKAELKELVTPMVGLKLADSTLPDSRIIEFEMD